MTGSTVMHHYRFDSAGKLDADDWLLVPRSELKADMELSPAFEENMRRRYLAHAERDSVIPTTVAAEADRIRLKSLLGKTALLLEDCERLVEANRVETSWRIAGGFMLAHRVTYGGRLFIGAAFEPGDPSLKLYARIRRFTPRLVNYLGARRGAAVYQRTLGAAQRRMHERFLRELAANLAGPAPL